MGAANILLVDDDQDCCAWLSGIFTERGYTVDMAYDGPSALELSGQNRYRLSTPRLQDAQHGRAGTLPTFERFTGRCRGCSPDCLCFRCHDCCGS